MTPAGPRDGHERLGRGEANNANEASEARPGNAGKETKKMHPRITHKGW